MDEKKKSRDMSLNLQKTGMKRRKKEIRNMRGMAMLSVIFLTLTLLFSENMKAYQQEINFHYYGEWFMCQPDGLVEISNAYLKKAGRIFVGSKLFCLGNEKENGRDRVKVDLRAMGDIDTGAFLGAVDSEAVRMGNIRLYEGKIPEREDEIAMELSVLQAFGYNYDIGQTVSVYLTGEGDGEDGQSDDEETELYRMDFRLVGTIKSYTAHWSCGDNMPGAIVSAAAYKKIDMPKRSYTFLQLKEQYEEVDTLLLKEGIFEALNRELEAARIEGEADDLGYCYNEFAYADSFWNNQIMYRNMLLLLMVTGAAALAYLMSSYLSRRRVFYYKLRGIGATAMQIRKMALYECAYSTFLPSALAIALSYLLSVIVVWVVAKAADISFFYVFHWKTLGMVICAVLAVLTASMAAAVVLLGARRIEEKRRAVSPRLLKRLGRRARRRKRMLGGGEFLCRERMQHPLSVLFRRIFGILVCTVILCCMAQIYYAVRNYNLTTVRLTDYSLSVPLSSTTVKAKDVAKATGVESDLTLGYSINNMEHIMPDSVLMALKEQMGIQNILGLTCDETHFFQWEGKQKSDLWRKNLANEAEWTNGLANEVDGKAADKVDGKTANGEETFLDLEKLLYMAMYGATYYQDCQPVWKEVKKHLDLDIADYDKLCEGKQVILFLYDSAGAEEEALMDGGGRQEAATVYDLEKTLKAGDILQIQTRGNPISVEIAGIIDVQEISWFSGNSVYSIVGSEALGRAVAKEDGIDFGYTNLKINLNRFASGEATGKVITRLCTSNDLEYESYMENIDYFFQIIVRKIFVYGTLAVIILIIYIFISSCIQQEERRKKQFGRRMLYLLGMSDGKMRRMEWREGVQEGLVLWACVLSFAMVQAVQSARTWAALEEKNASRYVTVIGKYIPIYKLRELIFYDLLDSLSVWWLIVFLLGMAAVTLILHMGRKDNGTAGLVHVQKEAEK